MKVETQNTAPSFTARLWITGAPIGTDTAPTNLASVPEARRITVPSGIFVTPGLSLIAYAIDGSSTIVGRFWWYDHVQLIWVPNGAGVTLTTATTNSGAVTIGCMPGALHHFQVTANAGSTTQVAILTR